MRQVEVGSANILARFFFLVLIKPQYAAGFRIPSLTKNIGGVVVGVFAAQKVNPR